MRYLFWENLISQTPRRMTEAHDPPSLSFTTMSSTQTPFPPVRRVVTGHTPDGKSTVLQDTVQPGRFYTPDSIAPLYDLHYTGESPAVIDTEISKGKWEDEIKEHPEVATAGSNFRCWDFAPGEVSVIIIEFPRSCVVWLISR